MTTLKDKIQQELKRLEARSEPAGGQLTVLLEDGRLQCQLLARDSLGCAFHRLDYTSDKLADATPERLQQISQTLSEQLRYLLEPIRPIEADQQGCSVQLRSEPPSKDEDGTSYYEVVVQRGGQVALCRYNKLPGQPRQLVPTQVTYQVLHRLAADLVAAID